MIENSTIQLQYRPDLHVLVARWTAQSASDAIEAGYQALEQATQQYQAHRLLVDVRRRPVPTPEQAHWIAHVWLPQVAAACSPVRLRLAYLLSPAYEHSLQNAPSLQPSLQAVLAPNLPYDLRTFVEESAAMEWLQQG
ncbi:hypothetical protein [Solirubrum puertoriconensis]|uniref:STAS/SEC14 domain-containing protein n=1 Tax=Solirubrum puertoriconensis TaxID=1751427 RepID=A0A9X0HLD1_SOLP1|nr:hypothetical protein [Solirubrum puertoriconensis]KUG08120.1 hypothetical protein ASU33_07945 [Solirubrum puertoriconensis]